jgi:pantoate--beta-alanine ligase
VATVVCRLFHAVPADAAWFGAKDWQQTLVVRRMVADLGLPIEIVVAPTVREADGLAMSSRNAYLSAADRPRATALFASLSAAARLWADGRPVPEIEREMRRTLESRGVAVDYAAIADPESLAACGPDAGRGVAIVAGRLGATRLIDNLPLPDRPAGARP